MYENLKTMQLKKFKTCVHPSINLHIQNLLSCTILCTVTNRKSFHPQAFNHDEVLGSQQKVTKSNKEEKTNIP